MSVWDTQFGEHRVQLVFPLFLAGVAVLIGRLYTVQVLNHDRFLELASQQNQTTVELPASRGSILDRQGRPLALSLERPGVFADPGVLAVPRDCRTWLPDVLAVPRDTFRRFRLSTPGVTGKLVDPTYERMIDVTRQLAAHLGLPEGLLLRRLEQATTARLDEAAELAAEALNLPLNEVRAQFHRDTRFVWLKRAVDDDEAARVRAAGLRGLSVRGDNRRADSTARGLKIGQWLGFVNTDGRGAEGIELQFDEYLRGQPGLAHLIRDGRGRRIAHSAEPDVPPRDGSNLYLTIDRRIQAIVDDELLRIKNEFSPLSASCIVMDPHTGEILAMGSVPGLDVSVKRELSRSELQRRLRNHPVQSTYEYGSTFKPIIAAAAIEKGVVTPETEFYCENGQWRYRARTIRDVSRHGTLTVTDIVAKSSNIGMAKIGLELGPERMQAALRTFHFGERLKIQLPAEEPGMVTPPQRWTYYSTTSVPFGQEISGTPLQLVTAFSALINGGELMWPYVVAVIENPNTGEIRRRRPAVIRRVISPETSAAMRRILRRAVEDGTGRRLNDIPYSIGGKTGTAQKQGEHGGYARSKYVASFVGFAPSDRPELCVLVLVDEPKGEYYGGAVAAPPVGRIIQRTLAMLESAPIGRRGPHVVAAEN